MQKNLPLSRRKDVHQFSVFVELFLDSLDLYLKRLSLVSLFIIPLTISYLLLLIMRFDVFTSFGSLMLRYEDITDINIITFLFIIGLISITAFLHSFLTTGITLIAVHLRTGTKYALTKLQKDFTYFLFKIFSVKLFLYLLNISAFVIGRIFPLSHIINILINMSFAFVPQSIIIEDVKPFTALKHSLKFIKNNLKLATYYFVTLLILYMAQELFLLIPIKFAYEFLTLAFNVVFILPFSEILASFLYMEKYTIAAKKTHLK